MRSVVQKIAFGGTLVALFVITSFYSISDSRLILAISNIVKISIVSVYSYKEDIRHNIIFSGSCICTTLILIPFHISAIHTVTTLICGICNGRSLKKYKFFTCIMISFAANVVTFFYEMALSYLLLRTNTFIVFTSTAKRIFGLFSEVDFVNRYVIPNINIYAVVICLADLFVTSMFILLLNRFIIGRLKKVLKM